MKRIIFIWFVVAVLCVTGNEALAQCSICAKTVMQMGTKPAEGFNAGILYLMIIPYIAIGVIGFRWWKNERTKS